jgi:hypothetical protein
MTLPPITKKQQEVLTLLYKYRFLNRIQIQAFLNHKDKKTINLWLKDLKEKQYVEWIYSTHFAEKTKPAVYYMGLNGVRWLKQQTYVDDEGDEFYRYPLEEVRKRYREAGRSQAYIDRCLMLADCCVSFTVKARDRPEFCYTITTQTEYQDEDNEFNFLVDGDLESQLGPQLVIARQVRTKGGVVITNFLLEIFDVNLPRYRVSKRLKQYIQFLTEGDWEANRDDNDPLPIIMLVCPRLTDLIYAKRRTRGLLKELWDDDRDNVHIRFATADKAKEKGTTSIIWEEA